MQINTLSAYQTDAEDFFNKILEWKADLVLDIRLKNTNQLSGFTKQKDLEYFTHVIAHADYIHDIEYSPTKELLDSYLDKRIDYKQYFAQYKTEMEERGAIKDFFDKYGKYKSIAIVGTATDKRRSHAEELKALLEEAMKGESGRK